MTDTPARHTDRDRAESFGEWAADYDAHRESYPVALIDHLVATPPREVLDVGCGTGKLGALFVERGFPVVGVEPDSRMAEVARGHGLGVDVSTFEQWDRGDRQFDLITAGTSWHWVEPVAGCAVAFDALRPGGQLALVWHLPRRDDAIDAAINKIYATVAPEHVDENQRDDHDMAAAFAPLLTSPWVDPANQMFEWSHTWTPAEWIAYLETTSTHRVLTQQTRDRLYASVFRAIEGHGGSLTIDYTTLLLSARKPA